MIDSRHGFRISLSATILLLVFFALMLTTGCGGESEGGQSIREVLTKATPTPPPFQSDTLVIDAGNARSMSYSVSSNDLSQAQGRWCFEYEADLIQKDSRNDLDLDSYVTLPTGEKTRQVTIDSLNSPIRGKIYAEQAGGYSVVLDNQSSLFTSKTVVLKTRMYTPCR